MTEVLGQDEINYIAKQQGIKDELYKHFFAEDSNINERSKLYEQLVKKQQSSIRKKREIEDKFFISIGVSPFKIFSYNIYTDLINRLRGENPTYEDLYQEVLRNNDSLSSIYSYPEALRKLFIENMFEYENPGGKFNWLEEKNFNKDFSLNDILNMDIKVLESLQSPIRTSAKAETVSNLEKANASKVIQTIKPLALKEKQIQEQIDSLNNELKNKTVLVDSYNQNKKALSELEESLGYLRSIQHEHKTREEMEKYGNTINFESFALENKFYNSWKEFRNVVRSSDKQLVELKKQQLTKAQDGLLAYSGLKDYVVSLLIEEEQQKILKLENELEISASSFETADAEVTDIRNELNLLSKQKDDILDKITNIYEEIVEQEKIEETKINEERQNEKLIKLKYESDMKKKALFNQLERLEPKYVRLQELIKQEIDELKRLLIQEVYSNPTSLQYKNRVNELHDLFVLERKTKEEQLRFEAEMRKTDALEKLIELKEQFKVELQKMTGLQKPAPKKQDILPQKQLQKTEQEIDKKEKSVLDVVSPTKSIISQQELVEKPKQEDHSGLNQSDDFLSFNPMLDAPLVEKRRQSEGVQTTSKVVNKQELTISDTQGLSTSRTKNYGTIEQLENFIENFPAVITNAGKIRLSRNSSENALDFYIDGVKYRLDIGKVSISFSEINSAGVEINNNDAISIAKELGKSNKLSSMEKTVISLFITQQTVKVTKQPVLQTLSQKKPTPKVVERKLEKKVQNIEETKSPVRKQKEQSVQKISSQKPVEESIQITQRRTTELIEESSKLLKWSKKRAPDKKVVSQIPSPQQSKSVSLEESSSQYDTSSGESQQYDENSISEEKVPSLNKKNSEHKHYQGVSISTGKDKNKKNKYHSKLETSQESFQSNEQISQPIIRKNKHKTNSKAVLPLEGTPPTQQMREHRRHHHTSGNQIPSSQEPSQINEISESLLSTEAIQLIREEAIRQDTCKSNISWLSKLRGKGVTDDIVLKINQDNSPDNVGSYSRIVAYMSRSGDGKKDFEENITKMCEALSRKEVGKTPQQVRVKANQMFNEYRQQQTPQQQRTIDIL